MLSESDVIKPGAGEQVRCYQSQMLLKSHNPSTPTTQRGAAKKYESVWVRDFFRSPPARWVKKRYSQFV